MLLYNRISLTKQFPNILGIDRSVGRQARKLYPQDELVQRWVLKVGEMRRSFHLLRRFQGIKDLA